jgi:choline monooxygenase
MAIATLPASWYTNSERFEIERRMIFGPAWQFIGFGRSLTEPGDYLAAEVAGWNVVVVVDDGGALVGHHNVCRHRAGPLVHPGTGHVPSLVCRYHGWAYGLDGGLRSARDFGAGIDCDAISLEPARVDQWRGLVFVNIDGSAPPLVDALGSFAAACDGFPIETFTPVGGRDHEIACNWKTYGDNYLEGYHIPLVHPGLNKEIDAKRYVVDVHDDGQWVEQSAPARDGSAVTGRWLWRWPNLALNLYADGLSVERYEPLSMARSVVRYSYALDPAASADDSEIVQLSGEVTAEDAAICEAVQRNLAGGVYREGWLSPRHEGAVAAFQRWVREATAYS